MRKLICLLAVCLLAVCLLMTAMCMNVLAEETVQSMIEGLPTVEQFRAMDADAQLEAYHKTQAAYDAYMALAEDEKAEVEGAEETFEALFGQACKPRHRVLQSQLCPLYAYAHIESCAHRS